MVSFAVGTMLAAAFLHLLPEAFVHGSSIETLFATALAGLLGFFLLEKLALWRHAHAHPDQQAHIAHADSDPHRVAVLVVVGDGFHNAVDGVLIASAFVADTALGIATATAIVAHEIPQELGDFMLLLNSGLSRSQALVWNGISSLSAVIGGVLGYFALSYAQQATPYMLTLAAASFIYIAVADLIPMLHRTSDTRNTALQVVLIAAGIATIALPHSLLHQH